MQLLEASRLKTDEKEQANEKAQLPPLLHEIRLRPVVLREDLLPANSGKPDPRELLLVAEKPSFWRKHALMLVTFVLPVMLYAVYIFAIASNRYVSESKYLIRSAPQTATAGVAANMLVNQGLSRAADETTAVNDYILSRDALAVLQKQYGLRDVFNRPEADLFNRFPPAFGQSTDEALYRYYKGMVRAEIEENVSVLDVTAFRPDDAQRLTKSLLTLAEAFVNQMNKRAYADSLAYADALVQQTEVKLGKVEQQLTRYRNVSGMVSPQGETAAAMRSLSEMSTQLSRSETSIAQQEALTPGSPALPAMREKVRAMKDQIASQKAAIAGSSSSIAERMGGFDRLTLDREIAARSLTSAEANRELAQQEAHHQQLYLQVIVQPNLSDQPAYPKRILYFMIALVVCFGLFRTASAIKNIIEEHSL